MILNDEMPTRVPCPACKRCMRCKGRSVEQCPHCDPLHETDCAACSVCGLCCGTQLVTVDARREWLTANPDPPPSAA